MRVRRGSLECVVAAVVVDEHHGVLHAASARASRAGCGGGGLPRRGRGRGRRLGMCESSMFDVGCAESVGCCGSEYLATPPYRPEKMIHAQKAVTPPEHREHHHRTTGVDHCMKKPPGGAARIGVCPTRSSFRAWRAYARPLPRGRGRSPRSPLLARRLGVFANVSDTGHTPMPPHPCPPTRQRTQHILKKTTQPLSGRDDPQPSGGRHPMDPSAAAVPRLPAGPLHGPDSSLADLRDQRVATASRPHARSAPTGRVRVTLELWLLPLPKAQFPWGPWRGCRGSRRPLGSAPPSAKSQRDVTWVLAWGWIPFFSRTRS